MDLKGRCALLTGAGGGIGRSLAFHLSAAGANIVLTGRDPDALEATRSCLPYGGSEAVVLPADLRSHGAHGDMVRKALDQFGRLDLVIHSAGVSHPAATAECDQLAFDEQIEVNCLAPMALTRAALPTLLKQSRSAVVHVLSRAALVPFPYLAAYSAAKAGLAAFGDALHREYQSSGLHVLNIYPGPTGTAMLQRSGLEAAMTEAESPAEVARATVDGILQDKREVVRGRDEWLQRMVPGRRDPSETDALMADVAASMRKLLGAPR